MRKIAKKLTFFEKMLFLITITLLVFFPVMSIFAKSILSQINYEVEETKEEVNKQSKENESIQMVINELASLENLENIAKSSGLSYTSDSIKMID